MRVTIGSAKFDAKDQVYPYIVDELRNNLEPMIPKVENTWRCPSGPTHPSPAQTKIDAPVLIGLHAADYYVPVYGPLGPLNRSSPEGKALLRKRAEDVKSKTVKLARWLLGVTGFATLVDLDADLQTRFGKKTGLSFEIDPLIKDHKARYSLRVRTKPDYVWFQLTHPKQPSFREVQVYLLMPVGLRHEVQAVGECTQFGGYRDWVSPIDPPDLPEHLDRAAVTGTDEAGLRAELVKKKIAAKRKHIQDLAERKREEEAKLKKLREDLERLKDEAPE